MSQRFVLNFEYDLPFERFTGLPKRLVQGWKLLGIFSAQSGFPFTVVGPYGTLQYGFDTFDGVGARPFLIQRPTRSSSGGPQYFSDAAIANNGLNGQFFALPTATLSNGTVVQTSPGNLGRNTFVGPGWWNIDTSLIKDTRIAESMMLQFRAEFFNLPNTATFATPNGTLGNPSCGLSTSTATAERQIQLGLRFMF